MAPAASPEGLEVRCAGCGETLEVDSGLTEFICPDCATPQSLPPELMPPPPPRRKALPLPHAAADVRGARLPCGSCGALLSVPVGLARCACPVCGADLPNCRRPDPVCTGSAPRFPAREGALHAGERMGCALHGQEHRGRGLHAGNAGVVPSALGNAGAAPSNLRNARVVASTPRNAGAAPSNQRNFSAIHQFWTRNPLHPLGSAVGPDLLFDPCSLSLPSAFGFWFKWKTCR